MGTGEAAQFFQGLVAAGIVDSRAIEDAQTKVGDDVYSVVAHLARSGAGDEAALAALTESPAARKKHFARVDESIAALIPGALAWKHRAVPIARIAGNIEQLVIAMRDPRDVAAIEELEVLSGAGIQPAVALDSTIETHLQRFYGDDKAAAIAQVEPSSAGNTAAGVARAGAADPRFAPPAVVADSEVLDLAEVPSSTELASGAHALPDAASTARSVLRIAVCCGHIRWTAHAVRPRSVLNVPKVRRRTSLRAPPRSASAGCALATTSIRNTLLAPKRHRRQLSCHFRPPAR